MSRSYRQCCPLTRALDVIGERWSLVIVRDLFDGPRRFSRLRADLPGLSPTLLAERLRDLSAHGVIASSAEGYELTERGRALWPAIAELARWGLELVDKPRPEDAPPAEHFARVGLQFLVRPEHLPLDGLVVDVELESGSSTLRVDPRTEDRLVGAARDSVSRVSLVKGRPSRADVRVRSTLGALTRIRQGRRRPSDLEADGLLTIEGPAAKREAFLQMIGARANRP